MPKIRYQCTKCKFQFSRAHNENKCPYCDTIGNLRQMTENMADELLKEVDGF